MENERIENHVRSIHWWATKIAEFRYAQVRTILFVFNLFQYLVLPQRDVVLPLHNSIMVLWIIRQRYLFVDH